MEGLNPGNESIKVISSQKSHFFMQADVLKNYLFSYTVAKILLNANYNFKKILFP